MSKKEKLNPHGHYIFTMRTAENGVYMAGKKSGSIEPEFYLVFSTVAAAIKKLDEQIKETFLLKEPSAPKLKKKKNKK